MKHWKRIQYALFFTVAVMMVIALIASFLEINIAPLVLSGALFIPIFLVAYLLAPILEKFIKESS
jgi:membrane protease YdiL (CAAX protease family)